MYTERTVDSMISAGTHIALSKDITAIQIEYGADGKRRCGLMSQLPRDAEVKVCGDGFNPRTAEIECGGQLYFVFLQDIEQPENYIG